MHSHSWSLVVTRGQLVVTRGHSWSFVVTRGHSCVLLDTTVLCKQVVFCHVQTCDDTKFNGESRDCHKTVISSFSALFIGFRGS